MLSQAPARKQKYPHKHRITPFKPSEPSLTDLVLGVLAKWTQSQKKTTLTIDSVYFGFYRLAQKNPNLFGGLYFSGSKKSPYSKKLEDILFFLGSGGILSVENPKFKYFKISGPSKDNVVKELGSAYGDPFMEQLGNLTREFAKHVKDFERDSSSSGSW